MNATTPTSTILDNTTNFHQKLHQSLECPILKSWPFFPVTTSCGHTFDKLSLLQFFNNKSVSHCPVCRSFLFRQDIMFLSQNIQQRDMIERVMPICSSTDELAEYDEETKENSVILNKVVSNYMDDYQKYSKSSQECVACLITFAVALNRHPNVKTIIITPQSKAEYYKWARHMKVILSESSFAADTLTKICHFNQCYLKFPASPTCYAEIGRSETTPLPKLLNLSHVRN